MTWLRSVRAALDEADEAAEAAEAAADADADADSSRPFFFRDDDAGWRDDRLRAVLDCFQTHAVPVDVAVIPAELTPGLARELKARGRDTGVRVHQHGYAHTNHELSGRKCEFGPARDAAAHVRDIAAGQRRMHDAFGPVVDAVFTPPWNRCVPGIAGALVPLGFEVLSRDSTAAPLDPSSLAEVPVTVDWFGHHKGIRWTRDELGEVIAASIRRDRAVGVMVHHAVTDDSDLAGINDLLALVAGHPCAHPTTIMALARSGRWSDPVPQQ